MKRFNQIIFLLSYCVCSTIFAMEVVSNQECRLVVDVDNKSIEKLVDGTIHYYDEYRGHIFRKDTTCFPVEYTDPLPIEYCGDQRFFVTSAIYFSSWMMPGQAYTITNPAIKQLAVVRGNVKSNDSSISSCRIHLYLGLETDRVRLCNKTNKRIYPAKVMAFEIKKQKDGEVGYYYETSYMQDAQPFDGMLLMEEVKKKFPQIECCDQTASLLEPLIVDLLGRNSQYFDFEKQEFNFTKRYWSKKVNHLRVLGTVLKDKYNK